MESSYLTVDLFRRLSQEVEKPVGPGGKPGNPGGYPAANAAVDRYSEGHFQRIGSNMSSYVRMVSERLRNMIPKAVVHCQVREAKMALLNHFYLERERLSLSIHTSTRSWSSLTSKGHADFHQYIVWSLLGQMLDEDLMERRLQCAKRLELYKSARDEVDSVSWVR
ncbi:putative dynamin GTPase effector, Dynamin superfamily [Rosa chinensis]|uniref:Putative dynamin GTPase effector, Dynamin superfamily n=1 Tax=Rosa chinensis TaxID=74649 RepID=A0A2P6SCH9_ROSCH|nr:putative dynamin GTPase effector, Dynamin superfamily [Rosa chinensis]